MPNRKRSYRSRSPSRHHDLPPSESPPKRRKTSSSPPSPGGKSLDSILQTLQQMQTEMTKTSERISTMESLFEQHSRTFAPLHPTPDDQISVLAYLDGELLDYSELKMTSLWSLNPKIRLLSQIIRLVSHHTRPLGHHTRQMSPKHLRKLNQMDRLVITLPLPHRCTTPIQQNHHGNLKRSYPHS